jgi:hypothetical protein
MRLLLEVFRRVLIGIVLATTLISCGSPSQSLTSPTTAQTSAGQATAAPASAAHATAAPASAAQTADVPACAKVDKTIPLPNEFPAVFPLPPGTVITSREDRSGGRIILNTVVPALDVKGVALFLEQELPKAGFTTIGGESEPGEAESSYEGNGYKGRWVANSIQDCPEAIRLIVLVGR